MKVLQPRPSDLGGGVIVRRALPHAALRAVGPFVFLDEMGPVRMAPGHGLDVRPHPHIGLATVTWLFEGELEHRDSLGNIVVIRPGAVNWMSAGHGIVHSERSPAAARVAGARLWGLQFWVALPLALEDSSPAFVHTPAEDIPVAERDGVRVRTILGAAFGLRSPAAVPMALFLAELHLAAGAEVRLEVGGGERAAYVVAGTLAVDGQAPPVLPGHLISLDVDEPARLRAVEGPVQVVVLGGPPLDAPRLLWWNFVGSRRDTVLQAQAAWATRDPAQFPAVPGETEFIPLPDRPLPQA